MLHMLVPGNLVFPGSWGYIRKWLVLHKSAGFHSAQDVAAYFQSGSNGLGVSSHYVIGQDGTVVQCVDEQDGAGANCCLVTGHDNFWPQGVNLNLLTFSIEHVDPATDNSTPLTDTQKAASFALIRGICERWGIPMRPADSQGGITGHYSIDPVNRARCPGNYPWEELWNYLGGTAMPIPQGWSDDGTTLYPPDKAHKVVHGFRDAILIARSWDAGNVPRENEQGVSQVELHASTGSGTRQIFRDTMLIWTAKNGVHTSAAGDEILACYSQLAAQRAQIAALQAKLDAVSAKIDAAGAIAAATVISTAASGIVATLPALNKALGVQ